MKQDTRDATRSSRPTAYDRVPNCDPAWFEKLSASLNKLALCALSVCLIAVGCAGSDGPQQENARYQKRLHACGVNFAHNKTQRGRCLMQAMREHYLWNKRHTASTSRR
ncbi:hypothetical protein [Acetobacter nitrogenifigens]|uniref:hypothetical protein n=1 Tax=Acetobacter nitrogenifigens TaxID=285268 RepID=UPI00041409D6|nr:hypothetical protein [Acetobacter nitrogenifigens]